jgi:ABC-type sugar transport system ATPase subunit
MKSAKTPLVSLEGISKSFGPVSVLSDVGFALEGGTITGLVGENGAGKSTLIKILSGAELPTLGTVVLGGEPLPSTTGAVINAGLSVIYQELTDIPDMSLLENVLLGALSARGGIKDRKRNLARAKEGLSKVGLGHVDPHTPIRALTISQRQLAEIARCLIRESRVLILDEPTSSLPEHDVDNLLAILDSLRKEGLAILYVTHHLAELFRLVDRIVVLRDGRVVGDEPVASWSQASLVRAMLAKDLQQVYPWEPREPGVVSFSARDVHARGVNGVSLEIREREIVGLVGLAGAGRTETLKAITGVAPVDRGRIEIGGKRLRTGSISAARRQGVLYGPEDRKREGLVLTGTIAANVAYGNYRTVSRFGILNSRKLYNRALALGEKFGIKFNTPKQIVGELSGGNQQKVVLARMSEGEPRIVCFDDPTRGVDIGAKSGIHDRILELAKSGASIFITSSDSDEVLAVSDRIYVLRGGSVVGEMVRADFDREKVLHLSSGANLEGS